MEEKVEIVDFQETPISWKDKNLWDASAKKKGRPKNEHDELDMTVENDLEALQKKQNLINDELRMLKEVQQMKKERLRLIKEQQEESINRIERDIKHLGKLGKERKIPSLNKRQGTMLKRDYNRPASSRSYVNENRELSMIQAIDLVKNQRRGHGLG